MRICKMERILSPSPIFAEHPNSSLRSVQHRQKSLRILLQGKSLRTCAAPRCQSAFSGGRTNSDMASRIQSTLTEESLPQQEAQNSQTVLTLSDAENEMEHKRKIPRDQEPGNAIAGNSKAQAAEVQNTGLRDVHTQRRSVHDFLEQVREHASLDHGPPRWFCPLESGQHEKRSPLLLFLPGMDGTGLGLILQHGSLGMIFEINCLQLPIMDRTPMKGLIDIVEQRLKAELIQAPSRPIFLVGDSLGAALALVVAARNPNADLSLVLANPVTCFERSSLQLFLSALEVVPSGLYQGIPFWFSAMTGDLIRIASTGVDSELLPLEKAYALFNSVASLLPSLPVLAEFVPRSTLLWRLKLAKSLASYANSCLPVVKAEVLVLASGKDHLLPSAEEAKRLRKELQKCTVRFFRESGHALLLEEGIDLATIVRGVGLYRYSKVHDFVSDFVYPTVKEFEKVYKDFGLLKQLSSPVFFSTRNDGKIIKGFEGFPQDRPILLVGNHMLMGLELSILVTEFLKQQNILVRGIAHPYIFSKAMEGDLTEVGFNDIVPVFGGVPATKRSFFKILARGESVLLYPGGAREALHRKGEAYKLFWPQESEFVRAAARFGFTIVPFGVVGEDDFLEILLDYNDMMKIPPVKQFYSDFNKKFPRLRNQVNGEVANQDLHLPVMAPKPPGRLYFLFGRPFPTSGRIELEERSNAQIFYQEVKREVEACLEYLQEKRKVDPFRGFVPRFFYESLLGQAPTFEP